MLTLPTNLSIRVLHRRLYRPKRSPTWLADQLLFIAKLLEPTQNQVSQSSCSTCFKKSIGPFGVQGWRVCLLVDHPLDTIASLLQRLHLRPVREAHEVVARGVEQVTPTGGVEVEEDAGDDDDLLLQAGLEEVEAVGDGAGQALEVQPQVEGRVGHVLDDEAHGAQAAHDVVALVAEVRLQGDHLGADQVRLQHGHGRLLEGRVGAAVQVGAAAADGLDELLGPQDPGHAPPGQPEALGQPVDDEHVVLVDVHDVLGRADGRAVAVGRVVVARVELVADEGGAAAADVLDLGQLRVLDDPAGRVARVGGQNDTRASSDFLGDLVRVDVVTVLLVQGNWDGSELEYDKPSRERHIFLQENRNNLTD